MLIFGDQNKGNTDMKNQEFLKIDASKKTPLVDLNSLTGELLISGRSIPENAAKIYEPIYQWVEDYKKYPRQITNIRLNLEYFNTASSLWISKIIKSLSKISQPDYVLFIHLYFDEEDFDEMESEDIKNALSPIMDIVSMAIVSIGIKVYGVDSKGTIVKESTILI